MTIPVAVAQGGPLKTLIVPPEGVRLQSGILHPRVAPDAYLFAEVPQSDYAVCIRAEIVAAYVFGGAA